MKNNTRRFYNRIAFLYPVIDRFLQAHKKRLIDLVNHESQGELLEVGVGSGSHLPLYRRHRITGIDLSECMLKLAARNKTAETVLAVMDAETMTFGDNRFDYVVMCHVLAVVENPDQLLAEVHRVLKPGGKLFLLNHFTPTGFLSYVDRIFQPFASMFHFRSHFYLDDTDGLKHFQLLKQSVVGAGRYFQILIYKKP